MANRPIAIDDRRYRTISLFCCRSQVPGQIASGTGTGHRFPRKHLLRRFIVNVMLFLSLLALLIPLVSCELDGNYKELKADELKKLIDDGPAILIVDNRSEYEYSRGHVPKAINIPQERFILLDTLLPKDKSFPIVFYCTGYG
jgi:hypothetical protein